MRIEDLCKEKKLWEGGPVPEAARKRRMRGGCGSVALVSGLMGTLLLFNQVSLILSALLLLPLVYYLLRAQIAFSEAKRIRYCVSEKGIYVQNRGPRGAVTEFRSFQDIHTIRTEPGEIGTGHLICEYGKPHPAFPYAIRLEDLPNCQQVFRIVREQYGAVGLAEQSALPSDPFEAERMAKKAQTESKFSRPSAEDMFFGEGNYYDLSSVNNDRKKRGMFLDPVIPAGSGFPEELPAESVMELQEELFGDEASRKDAFPDPTVNPLPELPEDDSDFFQQSGF